MFLFVGYKCRCTIVNTKELIGHQDSNIGKAIKMVGEARLLLMYFIEGQ
jgi:hypothetical protein